MSNSVSTAQQGKRHAQTRPEGFLPLGAKQKAFDKGTMNLLDEARGVVENAVGQGQELNPMIYQMLGLQPQYEDHSADLQSAQGEMDAAQKQWDEAQTHLGNLQGIPPKQRTPQQKKQLRELKNKLIPGLESALGKAKDVFGQLQTMPKTITGLSRMDPSQIPAESPFSAQNPLNALQRQTAERAQQYFAGGEVDPTLKHNYDQAESALRAKLEQRYGPDYENTSVGQMALQNFMQTKNRDFATWNEQQRQAYTQEAYNEQAGLQNLLGGQIGLLREPSSTALGYGNALQNLSANRLAQENAAKNWSEAHAGVVGSQINPLALPTALGQVGQTALTRLTGPTQDPTTGQMTGPSLARQGWNYGTGQASDLSNWISGLGAGSAAGGAGGYDAAVAGSLGGSEAAVGEGGLSGLAAA